MKKEDFLDLAEKISNGSASDHEIALYNHWYNSFQQNQHWNEATLGSREEKASILFREIKSQLEYQQKVQVKRLWPRIAAAASVLLISFIGAYLILHKKENVNVLAQNIVYDIAPGGNKATITLANGQQIALTGVKAGLLTNQGKTAINVKNAGEVVYNENQSSPKTYKIQYNTLTTPSGGQYKLVLSDGSVAMLDAASSITFPVSFVGKEREVRITGQVFFKVVHNNTYPFKVIAGDEVIEDIGTSFNVSAYADESIHRTTVTEGSVSVTKQNKKAVLLAGEQAEITGDKLLVNKVNTEKAVAWKNGCFRFSDDSIQTIMRQLSRWYNIEVNYSGTPASDGYSGSISRNKSIRQVLNMLERTQSIHFKIEGRRVIVLP
jgi:transmembrane sensor